MSNPVIQTSFNAGEWAPSLYSRVDLQKYHSGAALLQNFFVDYRGGATTRPGSKFVNRCLSSTTINRLIPFQASFSVGYILEFGFNVVNGNGTVRFYYQGAPVLENPTTISAINIGTSTITDVGHGYSNTEWVLISGIVGTVGNQLNGNYYVITGRTANTYTLTDLYGNPVVFTGAYTSGGTAQRVYTIQSPYLPNELFDIRYAQDVNVMFLCHPNHPPYQLTLNTATNWTLAPINFGTTLGSPVVTTVVSTLSGGQVHYGYLVTAVDINGQESAPGAGGIGNLQDIRDTLGSITVEWNPVTGAQSYNVYRADPYYSGAIPPGSSFGFVGNVTTTLFFDSDVVPDFSQGPPVPQNPFSGTGVTNLTLTANGNNYTSVPAVTFTAAPPGGITAQGSCTLEAINVTLSGLGGSGYAPGEILVLQGGTGLSVAVTSVGSPFGQITGFTVFNPGSVISGFVPGNPLGVLSGGGSGTGATFNATWGVASVTLISAGTGYLVTPTVGFVGGAGSGAAATATLGAQSAGNPTVPGYYNQRSVFGGPVGSPSQFNMSQPGSIYNFNVTFPVEADNAIQGTLISGQLNTIQAFIPMQAGLITLTDKGAWLINGGSPGSAATATDIVANPQAYNGSSNLPPIVATYDILYVQAKGSIVRDLTYNFYTNIFTGTDISVLSSHLFYGFNLTQWAYAEEPFKLVWATRNDGTLLSLTFQKEQEMIAWAHSLTQGTFVSVASITEQTNTIGAVDAVYLIVQRKINGQTVQYVERFVELIYPADYISSWQVDAGIGYNANAATTFSGAQHLAGAVVTGVADGVVINFTMPTSGTFVFGPGGTPGLTGIPSASVVTVGLSFLPQLTTLPLDLGEPTVQSKRKKVAGVTLKVNNTLGLTMGRTAATVQPLQDLILGNVGSMTNALVTGLVFGDVRGYSDPLWDVPGQYVIQQPNPYPASILGVIPELEIGDTSK